MRRSMTVLLAGLALLAGAAPAQATTRVPFVGPARSYELVGVCPVHHLCAGTRRSPGLPDPRRQRRGRAGAVPGLLRHGPVELAGRAHLPTIGSTVVTANADGTWTMVQKGSGLAVVPATDPAGPKLVWFTGEVTSIGSFDSKDLTFVPQTQVRSGIDSNICEMLVTGLKTRHDAH